MKVTLTWFELAMAAHVGMNRHLSSLRKNLLDRHGFEGSGWSIHIEGAAGEMAVAKLTQRYWNGSVNTFKQSGDVGSEQVRTRSSDSYDLLIRKDDPDDAVFWLVVGKAPNFRVPGWIVGSDAKKSEWLRTHGGREAAFFVPQGALKPMESWIAANDRDSFIFNEV